MADGKKFARGPRPVTQYLSSVPSQPKNKETIYIHVPFCNKICSFCSLRRSLQQPSAQYDQYVVQEIEKYAQLPAIQNMTFDAIYFGGGTPTTLSDAALKNILQALNKNFKQTDDVEITVETTVSELTDEKIHILQENGVNRFSVGVQTFSDAGRAQMNRKGSGKTAYETLYKLKNNTNAIISMDLIYSYEGQTAQDLQEDLKKINALNLDGFSMYSLIDMKPDEKLSEQALEEDEKNFYYIAEQMQKQGYHFLELTKMVKDDPYKYIMNRHHGADTLPLGAGAGGSVGGLMMMNEINVDKYAESVQNIEKRQGMLFADEYVENVRFKGDVQSLYLPKNTTLYTDMAQYEAILAELLQGNYVTPEGDFYRLTNKGIFWGNNISRMLSNLI